MSSAPDIQKADVSVRSALPLLLLGAAFISLAPICVRLSEIGPVATAFYRLLFALPVLWFWMLNEPSVPGRKERPRSVRDFASLALAGFFFTGDLALWHWSITLTTVANATLLTNMAPIFITLAGFVFFGHRFTGLFLVGLVIALAGTVLLIGSSASLGGRHLLGDVFGIGTAMFYGAYLMQVGRLRKRFSTATVMAVSGIASCIGLGAVAALTGEGFLAPTLYGWGVLVVLALVSHVGGQSMIAFALAHLPTAFGSVGLLLQPALAALIAWMLFDEALGLIELSGAAILLVGIFLARRGTV